MACQYSSTTVDFYLNMYKHTHRFANGQCVHYHIRFDAGSNRGGPSCLLALYRSRSVSHKRPVGYDDVGFPQSQNVKQLIFCVVVNVCACTKRSGLRETVFDFCLQQRNFNRFDVLFYHPGQMVCRKVLYA